jgi:hypothetical protein
MNSYGNRERKKYESAKHKLWTILNHLIITTHKIYFFLNPFMYINLILTSKFIVMGPFIYIELYVTFIY